MWPGVGDVASIAIARREQDGEPTRTRNKESLRKRLAWRIQELAERERMRQTAQVQDLGTVHPTEPRDPCVPPVGTVLRRHERHPVCGTFSRSAVNRIWRVAVGAQGASLP